MINARKAISSLKYYNSKYGYKISSRVFLHYLIRLFRKYLFSGKSDFVKIHGYTIEKIPNDPGISTELTIFKTHEPINTRILTKLIKNGMTCLDIGGNIGYYVLLERKLIGDSGKIIAFEPAPLNFQYLKQNIERNNFQNISLFNFACGNEKKNVKFFINKKSNGSQVYRNESPPDPSLGKIITVEMIILDDFLEKINSEKIDFIRMDAEGYELNIIYGLLKTLEKHKPIISIELHKRQLGIERTIEFFKILKSFGYEIESYMPRELDIPIIGSFSEIKKLTIDEIIKLLQENQIENYLMLNFVNVENY